MMKKVHKELEKRQNQALVGGGEKRIASQHAKKKLTARERIEYLLDEGSFEEQGMLVTHRTTDFGMDKQIIPGDGVITGYGTIHGRLRSEERRVGKEGGVRWAKASEAVK